MPALIVYLRASLPPACNLSVFLDVACQRGIARASILYTSWKFATGCCGKNKARESCERWAGARLTLQKYSVQHDFPSQLWHLAATSLCERCPGKAKTSAAPHLPAYSQLSLQWRCNGALHGKDLASAGFCSARAAACCRSAAKLCTAVVT